MAKLESMSDNDFEHDYPGPGSGPLAGPGPGLAMEDDPLFDPLGLPDEGQLVIQHQHMMGAPAPGTIIKKTGLIVYCFSHLKCQKTKLFARISDNV